jgi:hypothetical protein
VRRLYFAIITIGSLALALSGCATRPMGAEGDPGFWHGLLHGVIAPWSFLISLFSDQVRMYAFPNVGRWYDFGFLIGMGAWTGGAAARRS